MRVGSIFSGLHGLELLLPGELVWKCEKSLLPDHFAVPNLGDIRQVEWGDVPQVDLLVGGPPCQPVSIAGLAGGLKDERWLWAHAQEAVRILAPKRFFFENPPGAFRFWEEIIGPLAALGTYRIRWGTVRASDVGAPHRRERVFILGVQVTADALSDSGQRQRGNRNLAGATGSDESEISEQRSGNAPGYSSEAATDADRRRREQRDEDIGWVPVRDKDGSDFEWQQYTTAVKHWESLTRPAPWPLDAQGRLSPGFVEWQMGFPEGWTQGMSRTAALRALGNTVVPQQAALAWKLLKGPLAGSPVT